LLALRVAARRDVAEHQHRAGHGALPQPDGRGAVVDRNGPAISGDEHGVVGETHDPAFAEDPGHRILHRKLRGLVDDAEHRVERPVPRLGLGPAGQALGDRIHRTDPPGLVGRDHGVADAHERGPEPRFRARRDRGDGFRGRAGGLLALPLSRGPVEQGHRDADDEQGHTEPSDVRAEDRPALAPLPRGARSVEPVLLADHLQGQLSDLVHQALAAVGGDDAGGDVEPQIGARADGRVELGHLLRDRGLETPEAGLLSRIVLGELAERGQLGRHVDDRLGERREIVRIARDDVAALPGLRVLHEREDALGLLAHRQRMARACCLFLETVHPIEGEPGQACHDRACDGEADDAGVPCAEPHRTLRVRNGEIRQIVRCC
jgi:hypothetical protein